MNEAIAQVLEVYKRDLQGYVAWLRPFVKSTFRPNADLTGSEREAWLVWNARVETSEKILLALGGNEDLFKTERWRAGLTELERSMYHTAPLRAA